jgi:hypothetical protein
MTSFEADGYDSEQTGSEDSRSLIESPEVTLSFTGESGEELITLTWFNTELRYFTVGEGSFDHVVVTIDDDTVIGIKATDEVKQTLRDNNFPYNVSPYVDEFAEHVIAAYEAFEFDSDPQV